MPDAILVTGATGFIGTHLVDALRRDGRDVLTHSSRDGDIATTSLRFDSVGHVVHLAGRSFVPDSWSAPGEFYRVNVVGTINVLEFCRRQNAPLTFISSYVYGIPDALPIREDAPVRALNPYSHSKICAEAAVRYLSAQFGFSSTIIRPFNVYGPGQDRRFLIPTMIRQALDPAEEAIVVRDTRPKRDYLHVSDLVSLIIAAISSGRSGTYNAGSGRSASIMEIAGALNAMLERPKRLCSTGEERPEEVLDVVADIARARAELAWEPRVPLVDGLRDTVEAMRPSFASIR